jgi:hypothetical protein
MRELRESAFIEVKLFEKSKIRKNIRKTNNKIVDRVTSERVSKKNSSQEYNNFSIEAKFRHLKKLRDNEKISNKKYLEKKKELLREF